MLQLLLLASSPAVWAVRLQSVQSESADLVSIAWYLKMTSQPCTSGQTARRGKQMPVLLLKEHRPWTDVAAVHHTAKSCGKTLAIAAGLKSSRGSKLDPI